MILEDQQRAAARRRPACPSSSCRTSPTGSISERCTTSPSDFATREATDAAALHDGSARSERHPHRGDEPRVGPLAAKLSDVPNLKIDALLADRGVDIIVCCGSGGVGKTTTSAALALRAAEQGRKAVVLTIDPARRLAQSMGLTKLDNTPRRVTGVDESQAAAVSTR